MNLLQVLCGQPDEPAPPPIGPKTNYAVERVPQPPPTSTNDVSQQAEPLLGFHVSSTCPSCQHDTTDLFVLASVSAGGSGLLGLLTRAGVFGVVGTGAIYVNQVPAAAGLAVLPWQRLSAHID